MEIGAGK